MPQKPTYMYICVFNGPQAGTGLINYSYLIYTTPFPQLHIHSLLLLISFNVLGKLTNLLNWLLTYSDFCKPSIVATMQKLHCIAKKKPISNRVKYLFVSFFLSPASPKTCLLLILVLIAMHFCWIGHNMQLYKLAQLVLKEMEIKTLVPVLYFCFQPQHVI